jgi:Secretion system C-terminal sorting domain
LIESWKRLAPNCVKASLDAMSADIYPNPAQTELTVSLSAAGKSNVQATVQIVNLQGQVVRLPTQARFGTYFFDVSQLTNGVYVVTVQWENGQKTTQKVIITN